MERMLAAIFNDEAKAEEASRALRQLYEQGSITLYAESIIRKDADGTVTTKQQEGEFPIPPIPLSIGAIANLLADSTGDSNMLVDAEFLEEVAAGLKPGQCAVAGDIGETYAVPVDTRMEALGGAVSRVSKKAFEQYRRARDVAGLRAEILQLKAEHAQGWLDRKAKIETGIERLNAKMQSRLKAAAARLKK